MAKKTVRTIKLTEFSYEGTNRKGNRIKGYIHASSPALAKADLRRQGITPLKVKKKTKSWFGGKGKRIKPGDIAVFSRQIATMMKAGVALMESFDIVSKGNSNPRMQELLLRIKADIENGSPLAEALSKHEKYFDDLYVNLVNVGEQSGTLHDMLDRIATYKEKIESIKGKVKKALFYPISVMVVAVIVTAILLLWVVPQFEALFKSFGADLPVFTRFVIYLSELLQQYWYLLLLSLGCALLAFKKIKQRSQRFNQALDYLSLKVYVIGDIIEKSAIARYARTLSTTFAAGVPLIEGLTSVAGATGNLIFSDAVKRIKEDVATGQQLQIAMRSTNLFPNMVLQMVAIGEESGSLDDMLGKVADFYEEEVDNKVDALSSLLEPIIIVVLGVLIGGLIVAMYLPIFKMGAVVG